LFSKATRTPGQLEWVVKILLHSDGDIDFVKMDKEGDGYSLAHVAADQGYGNNK
jgi:hypothetical protein